MACSVLVLYAMRYHLFFVEISKSQTKIQYTLNAHPVMNLQVGIELRQQVQREPGKPKSPSSL